MLQNQYENILFYDEHLDEDGYDYDLIDEFFLNPKRKPVRIGKEHKAVTMATSNAAGGATNVNQFSRIETEEDENDSDSSITENATYQAL